MNKPLNLKYHHPGIPTRNPIEDEVYLKDYKAYHFGYEKSEYGIEWMRYEEDCNLPEIVKTLPPVAFGVEDIYEAIRLGVKYRRKGTIAQGQKCYDFRFERIRSCELI